MSIHLYICSRTNGLGYHEAFDNELGGGLFHHFIPLVVLMFFYFPDISFDDTYQLTGVGSLGEVLTVHICWEFNVGNSKFSGKWAMLPNRVGNPTCND